MREPRRLNSLVGRVSSPGEPARILESIFTRRYSKDSREPARSCCRGLRLPARRDSRRPDKDDTQCHMFLPRIRYINPRSRSSGGPPSRARGADRDISALPSRSDSLATDSRGGGPGILVTSVSRAAWNANWKRSIVINDGYLQDRLLHPQNLRAAERPFHGFKSRPEIAGRFTRRHSRGRRLFITLLNRGLPRRAVEPRTRAIYGV